jgi:hypothetical protein
MVANQQIIATHKRSFNRHDYLFKAWHYVPILKHKPGALRNGAPFKEWALPDALQHIQKRYLERLGGDREFVDLLYLIHRLTEPKIDPLPVSHDYPQLVVAPEANSQRYEPLRHQEGSQ